MTVQTHVKNPPRSAHRPARAFTITELLVVIALIVLLVGFLLAALGQVRAKSRETATIATMSAFLNACEVFQQEHGFYPGVVPEDVLAESTGLTGTQNALLHLMGGFVREEDLPAAEYAAAGGLELSLAGGYNIKVDGTKFGEGPIIAGKPFPPYFTPSEKEIELIDTDGDGVPELVDLIDGWGQPMAYMRRAREVGPLVAETANAYAQFDWRVIQDYVSNPSLGQLGGNNAANSILNDGTHRVGNLARVIEHPSLPNQSKGALILLSAGGDAIFFSKRDGPGSSEAEEIDISTGNSANYPASILDEYDDVIQFGGS